jgi:site-specific recombinase XerD
VADLD